MIAVLRRTTIHKKKKNTCTRGILIDHMNIVYRGGVVKTCIQLCKAYTQNVYIYMFSVIVRITRKSLLVGKV